ncbi:MAG: hypothetical protein K0Q72_5487 [Armatimonadetes bacterium]|jgi:hypothetical protein|nr:hypothetical protein [Armatimonadota bacterium]
MQLEPPHDPTPASDDWLANQCHRIDAAGRELALAVGELNERIEATLEDAAGHPRISEGCLQRARECATVIHQVQGEIQNALFDCEHEIRELRERVVSPAELLVDGERLINHYRFLRRRARVIDGLLAYLPNVTAHMRACVEHLRQMREEEHVELAAPLLVPDCAFAIVALEELREEEAAQRGPRF